MKLFEFLFEAEHGTGLLIVAGCDEAAAAEVAKSIDPDSVAAGIEVNVIGDAKDYALYTKGSTMIKCMADDPLLEEYRTRYPSAEIMHVDAVIRLVEEIWEKKFMVPPVEIPKDKYFDALKALPPHRYDGYTFVVSEKSVGTWTRFYTRVGEKFYTATRRTDRTTNYEFRTECADLSTC